MMGTAVYLHIPFCRAKCHYCDFLSYACSTSGSFTPQLYLQGLVRELAIRGAELISAGREVTTLYLGGGTPTVLEPPDMAELLSCCHRYLPLASPEWTVEANPGTITPAAVRQLAKLGVNRISLGVQDLCDQRLASLGRLHNAQQARQAFLLCRDYFPSVSLDLMAALPGQTSAQLLETLAAVCDWGPQHLSVYGLKVEEGTLLAAQVAAGQVQLPDEDEVLTMFLAGRQYLQSRGYEHYEIANYARPGHQCRHNLTYWSNQPYLGLGLGAHSYWQGVRWENTRDPETYLTQLAAGQLPQAVQTTVTKDEAMEDTMMLGLRLLNGVSFADFQEKFGQDLRQVFNQEIKYLQSLGAVECDEHYIRLSEKGLPVANVVFAEFLR
ncbi:MAG TPA: radical SAM family heme chaperone HemW [Oscillospiraceae bacterium]|nr:radical SAM family heme chaperone HemW [Oscillospiraceae bacterium]